MSCALRVRNQHNDRIVDYNHSFSLESIFAINDKNVMIPITQVLFDASIESESLGLVSNALQLNADQSIRWRQVVLHFTLNWIEFLSKLKLMYRIEWSASF